MGSKKQFKSPQLTKITNLTPNQDLKKDLPIIEIDPEEYVIDSLNDNEKIKNEIMYEFYQFASLNKTKNNTQGGNNDHSNDSDDEKKLLIIVICAGGILVILLAILVVIVLVYNAKTKDLLENVNKISFANEDKKGNNESLVLK